MVNRVKKTESSNNCTGLEQKMYSAEKNLLSEDIAQEREQN